MAVSISLAQTVSARVAKNSNIFSANGSRTDTSYGAVVSKIQIIGTSAELLNLGDISGIPTLLLVKHNDTANFVELALDAAMTKKIAKIYPTRFAVFAPTAAAIYARANTDAVKVLVFAVGA